VSVHSQTTQQHKDTVGL